MKIVLYLCLLGMPFSSAQAQDSTSVLKKEKKVNENFIAQIGIGIGLNGLNMDFTHQINVKSLINLQTSYLFYQNEFNQNWGTFKVSSKPNLNTLIVGLSYDWFPWATKKSLLKTFKLKTGLQYSSNPNYKFKSFLTDAVTWGQTTFTTEQVGYIQTIISGNKIQPFLSAGFDQFFKKKRLSFSADFGTLYQGEPTVSMTATNMLAPTVSQAKIIQDNINSYRFIPYLALKIGYNFNRVKSEKSIQLKTKSVKN